MRPKQPIVKSAPPGLGIPAKPVQPKPIARPVKRLIVRPRKNT